MTVSGPPCMRKIGRERKGVEVSMRAGFGDQHAVAMFSEQGGFVEHFTARAVIAVLGQHHRLIL